jgi:hypothetical protein
LHKSFNVSGEICIIDGLFRGAERRVVFYRRRAIRALPVAVRVGPRLACHAARALASAASNSSTELFRSCGLGLALGTPLRSTGMFDKLIAKLGV